MKYRKKPVIIEAIQFTGDNGEEIENFTNCTARRLATHTPLMIISTSERIYPDEKCAICGASLEAIQDAGDEGETVFIGCPNKEDEKDGHTEYNGQPRATLKAWGWKI